MITRTHKGQDYKEITFPYYCNKDALYIRMNKDTTFISISHNGGDEYMVIIGHMPPGQLVAMMAETRQIQATEFDHIFLQVKNRIDEY